MTAALVFLVLSEAGPAVLQLLSQSSSSTSSSSSSSSSSWSLLPSAAVLVVALLVVLLVALVVGLFFPASHPVVVLRRASSSASSALSLSPFTWPQMTSSVISLEAAHDATSTATNDDDDDQGRGGSPVRLHTAASRLKRVAWLTAPYGSYSSRRLRTLEERNLEICNALQD